MSLSLCWLQTGACSGDSVALLSASKPDLIEALQLMDIDLLWHPSWSGPHTFQPILERLESGEQTLDVLCIEGAVILGPGGTGMYDTYLRRPKKDLVYRLAQKARYILAVGTCAAYGGLTAAAATEATGLQFLREERGGFLGADFVSQGGLPVINLSGCPTHPEVLLSVLASLAGGTPIELDELQRPRGWFGTLVHQGCTRNEYHEFRVEEADFGDRGCLFFHLGCQGPLAHGPCNKLLWNNRSSKTRVGVPCHGCTRPDFPRAHPFFSTRNIEGTPLDLPDGVKRAHYMVYKNMARVATPDRLKDRDTLV